MKTVLYTHAFLDLNLPGYSDNGRCRRLERFMHHYGNSWPVVLLDNGSATDTCTWIEAKYDIRVVNAQPHLPRIAVTDYPAIWRCYWYVKKLLEEYEKVVLIATDAYILSQRLADYIEGLDSGWTALWSPKYNCPATEIQVIVRGCKAFEDFFSGDFDLRYNGKMEETIVPLTHVEKSFVGDRYGEYEFPQNGYAPGVQDYYTQVPDSLDWDDSVFPVLRRVDGKIQVRKLAP
jgi:hypothetical protein